MFEYLSSQSTKRNGRLGEHRQSRNAQIVLIENERLKDIEVVPMEKIVTVLREDTFGVSRTLPDYVVESTLHRVGESSTQVEISHYYSTKTLKAKLLNLIAGRKIARETQAMLNAMKGAIETAHRGAS
jgi:hypothetical protein